MDFDINKLNKIMFICRYINGFRLKVNKRMGLPWNVEAFLMYVVCVINIAELSMSQLIPQGDCHRSYFTKSYLFSNCALQCFHKIIKQQEVDLLSQYNGQKLSKKLPNSKTPGFSDFRTRSSQISHPGNFFAGNG